MSRDVLIDRARGLGIIAVVLGHIASPIGAWIYSWHMPLFFFLSGMMLKNKQSVLLSAKEDFAKLYRIYFIFGLFGIAVEAIKRKILGREMLDFTQTMKGFLLEMDFQGLGQHYGFVLWFIPALFFSRVIARSLFRCGGLTLFFMAVTLFYIQFATKLPNLYFGLDQALMALPWVLLGVALKSIVSLARFYGITFVILCLLYQGDSLNLAMNDQAISPRGVFYAIGMIFSVFDLGGVLKFQWLGALGHYSLIVFVLHPYTNNLSHLIDERFTQGGVLIKFALALLFAGLLVGLKKRFPEKGVLKYV